MCNLSDKKYRKYFSVSFSVLTSWKQNIYVNTSGSIKHSSKTKQTNLGQTVTFALQAHMINFSAFFSLGILLVS